jgi:phosphoglycolate phosphatase
MELQSPKVVVFDWDGTIMDSVHHIISCVKTATTKMGIPMPSDENIRDVIGLSLQVAVQRLFPDLGMIRQTEMFSEFRHAYFAAEQGPVPVFPNVETVLEYLLAKDIVLAVATGKGRIGLEHDLENTGLKKYFSATRCGDEAFSKPHPSMLLELMEQLDVSPHQTIMVGDSSHDILMAKNAKVGSIAAAYGTHPYEELIQYEPDYIIRAIEEMTTLIK